MRLTALFQLTLLGLVDGQKTISGGLITEVFAPCDKSSGCNQGQCCNFVLEQYEYSQDLCVLPNQQDQSGRGFYQDTENYPFPKYRWTCGSGSPYYYDDPYGVYQDPNYHDTHWLTGYTPYGPGQFGYGSLPVDLRNDDKWLAAWFLMMVFCISGVLWIGGLAVLIPSMLIYMVIELEESLIAFQYLTVGDYQGRYLTFNDWVAFPLRRTVVQMIINLMSLVILLIPGVSVIVMPFMGLWSVHNLLDYQNWNQVWFTFGLPFMRPSQYDYNLLMEYQY